MPLETSNRICPLCRRLVADRAAADATRLCHECRSMIDAIRPRAAVNPRAAIAPQYAFALPGQSPIAAPSVPQTSAAAFEIVADEEDFDLVSLQPEPETDYFDDAEERLAPVPEPLIATPQAFAAPSAAQDAAAVATVDAPKPFQFDSIGSTIVAEPAPLPLEPPQTADHEAWTTDDHTHDEAQPQAVTEFAPDDEKAVIDPWDDPLPPSEYSRNEWPVLMAGHAHQKRRPKWLPIAAAVLIVMAVAAYFFIIEPGTRSPQQPQTKAEASQSAALPPAQAEQPTSAADQSTPPQTASNNDAHLQAVSTAPAPVASEKPTTPAPTAAANANAPQWKHALQVLASPNQGEANQMVEKLKSAGIPAYVVVADLGSRGRWFRVRIGGFAAAADAQRFAAEARTRAHAAGIALKDLNVCDYEKP